MPAQYPGIHRETRQGHKEDRRHDIISRCKPEPMG
jgi:hypothetical protein